MELTVGAFFIGMIRVLLYLFASIKIVRQGYHYTIEHFRPLHHRIAQGRDALPS